MKKKSAYSLLVELLEESVKKNYQEQINGHERRIELNAGNLDELLKRLKALEQKLGYEYYEKRGYKSKKK